MTQTTAHTSAQVTTIPSVPTELITTGQTNKHLVLSIKNGNASIWSPLRHGYETTSLEDLVLAALGINPQQVGTVNALIQVQLNVTVVESEEHNPVPPAQEMDNLSIETEAAIPVWDGVESLG